MCTPEMPCYPKVYYTYPYGCDSCYASQYLPIKSDNVNYVGANLPYTEINNNMTLTESLQRIDAALNPEEIVNAFLAAIQSNPTLKAALCAQIASC